MNFFHVTRGGTSATVTITGEIVPPPLGPDPLRLVEELDGVQEVELIVDSIGGDAETALAVARAIRRIPRSKAFVRTACSAAAVIVCACQRVAIEDGGTVMVHKPITACFGNVDELRRCIVGMESLGDRCLEFICRPRVNPEEARKWMAGPSDRWFTAAQALGAGLADERIQARPVVPSPSQGTESRTTSLQDDSDEDALFTLLEAFGAFKVADQNKFAQRLNLFLLRNIQGGSNAGV